MGARTPPSIFPECVDTDTLQAMILLLHVARQGMYAGEVGVPRLLKLFKKYGITTTWFIPGECVLHISSRVCLISCAQDTAWRHSQRRWLLSATLDTKCMM